MILFFLTHSALNLENERGRKTVFHSAACIDNKDLLLLLFQLGCERVLVEVL